MSLVFPYRNLPPRSEQWGRAIEGEIREQEKSLQQFSSSVGNSGRYSSGQLSVMARNLDEIASRSTEVVRLDSFSVSGSATSEPFPRQERDVTFPAVSETRNALISISGNASSSANVGARLYVFLLYQGEVISSSWAQPYSAGSTPVEWLNDAPIFSAGNVVAPGGGSVTFTVRIVRASDSFAPGSSTLTLESPIVSLTRSGAV